MQAINKRPIYYANFVEKNDVYEVIDGVSRRTGESELIYSDPTPLNVNISAGKSGKVDRIFGESLEYERYFFLDELPDGFDEQSIIWAGNQSSTDDANYKIEAIYPYLNYHIVLIRGIVQ